MKKILCRGVIPALVSPVKKDETIDTAGLKRLLEYQIKSGVNALFVLGTNGEFANIRPKEQERLIKAAVKITAGRVPVLAGTSDTGTLRVIENTLRAKKLGADAAVVLTPYFFGYNSQETIYRFFADISSAVDFPVIVYHNPARTGVKLTLETIVRLSRIKNIIGIKDSSGDYALVKQQINAFRKRNFFVLQGDETVLIKSLQEGADGMVSGIASIAPGICVRLYEAMTQNNKTEAERAQAELMRILTFCDTSWIRAFKYGLKLMNICEEHACSPLDRLTPAKSKQVRTILKSLNLLPAKQ